MSEKVIYHLIVPKKCSQSRLDKILSTLLPQYSRMQIQQWIKNEKVTINHQTVTSPSRHLASEEKITLEAEIEPRIREAGENIPLDIIYEDKDILVINKPIGLIVHPGAGNRSGTLLNALLHYLPKSASNIPRAGIVHRLDKNTSGLLVVAKTTQSYLNLIKQLQHREIHREYEAIVYGVLTGGGTVDAPIGRHPRKRTHMTVIDSGKPAITHYRILKKFQQFTHIQVTLDSGRTHQIRVHMAFIKHPIVGDVTYCPRTQLPKNASPEFIEALKTFKHQALHARKLGLIHPISQRWMEWEVKRPQDFQNLLMLLEKTHEQ